MRKAIFISILTLAVACRQQQTTQSTADTSVVADETKILKDEVFSPAPSYSAFPKTELKGKPVAAFKKEKSSPGEAEESLPVPPQYAEISPVSFSALAERYAPTQVFQIDPNRFNTISGTKGSSIRIPPSAFLINDSTFYEGSVTVEMREVLSKTQMVFANFTTTSNNRILESAGMMYWNATTEDGAQLQMDSGAFASVTFPGRSNSNDYQLFIGNVSDGLMNWALYPTPKTSLPLAIAPTEYLHYKRFKISQKIPRTDKLLRKEWNDQVQSLSDGEYAFTQLSTKEFLRRMERIRWMGWNTTLLDFYLQNPNDLHTADSLAMLQVGEYAANIKESSFGVSRKYFAIGAGKKRWIRESTRAFRRFYEESNCYDSNITLSGKDLRNTKQLESKGIDAEYARWLTHSVVIRKKLLNGGYTMVDVPRSLTTSYVSSMNTSSVSLRVPAMWYINCDRFINVPKRQDIMVQIENYDAMEKTTGMLVFKNLNSVMSAYNLNGLFTFKDVPTNYSLHWVVIGTLDNKLYYASQEINAANIPGGIMKAKLKPATPEEVEKAIAAI